MVVAKIETNSLKEKAVCWEFVGYDAGGQPTVDDPVEIPIRWMPGRRQTISQDSAPKAYDVSASVDREISLGSILRLGKLAELPTTPDNLYEVINYKETPDLKAKQRYREIQLVRWTAPLPTT